MTHLQSWALPVIANFRIRQFFFYIFSYAIFTGGRLLS